VPSLQRHSRNVRPIAAVAAGALWLCGAAWAPAAPPLREAQLTVGHGWALVRELRSVSIMAGEQELFFEDIPAAADLSSFIARARHVPLRLLDWGWVDATRHAPAAVALAVDAADTLNATRQSAAALPPEPAGPLRVRISSPLNVGRVTLELLYVVPGFDWSVSYQLSVRGDQAEENEPVSIDLTGMARVFNPTGREYVDALVTLVGEVARPGPPPPAADPGFLELNLDNPLSDLWLEVPVRAGAGYAYRLPGRQRITARARTGVLFAQVARRPAERIYVMQSERFPVDSSRLGYPLSKVIQFRNTTANGLGLALPPGVVQIFAGGQRTHLLQQGWFSHAPAGGTIRVELGPSDEVRALRRTRSVNLRVDGAVESDFQIVILNTRERAVRLELDENPPVGLEWEVLRANRNYELRQQRLFFRTEVEPRAQLEVDYRILIRKPRQ